MREALEEKARIMGEARRGAGGPAMVAEARGGMDGAGLKAGRAFPSARECEGPKGTKGSRVGERMRGRQGLMMEIVAWRSPADMDVRFDDGTVRENVPYALFLTGRLRKEGPGSEKG